MRWAVEIENTQLERRNLEDLLARLGYAVVESEPHIAVSSADIDACSTATEAYAIGKRIREGFSGAAEIDKDFKLGAVIEYSTEPARRHYFLEIQSAFHTIKTIFAPSVTVSPPRGLSAEEWKSWEEARLEAAYQMKLEAQLALLEPAFFNPKAAQVLKLLAIKDPTGETLFKIYELMRGERANGRAFGSKFGISNTDFRRFSDTVHNDSVSGDWARHAHGEPPSTEQPMTKGEAEAFVRRIANVWLQEIRIENSMECNQQRS